MAHTTEYLPGQAPGEGPSLEDIQSWPDGTIYRSEVKVRGRLRPVAHPCAKLHQVADAMDRCILLGIAPDAQQLRWWISEIEAAAVDAMKRRDALGAADHLSQTAYHEAGHVVAMVRHGKSKHVEVWITDSHGGSTTDFDFTSQTPDRPQCAQMPSLASPGQSDSDSIPEDKRLRSLGTSLVTYSSRLSRVPTRGHPSRPCAHTLTINILPLREC